jgi:hypothetical protein
MSTLPTERDIEQTYEQAIEHLQPGSETDAITVQWGTADPNNRPDGMTWVPETQTITYDLWKAQREALDAIDEETDVQALLGGYGSGKTILSTRWLLKQAIEFDGSRFLLMGIDFSKAKQTTFRTLFEQLPGENTHLVTSSYNGPEQSPIVADYNRQEHRLTLQNGTVIVLGSADKWSRYAGESLGAVVLDEPSHYNDLHNILEMIGSRLRGEDGPKVQLWSLTGNGHNAAYDILERGVDGNGDPLGLNIEVVRASTLDNPYLTDEDKQRFKRQYANTSREGQALFGGFATGGGNLLKQEQLTFVDADELPEANLRYRMGVDLGYVSSQRRADQTDSDYTAVACVAINTKNDTAYLFDTAKSRGDTLREAITFVASIADQLPEPTVCIESVGGSQFFVDEAREQVPGSIHEITPTDSKQDRVTDMSVLFDRGDVALLNDEINDDLGYDERFLDWVREYTTFGATDDSPDLLDATWLALNDAPIGNRGGGLQIYSGTYRDSTPTHHVF